MIKGTMKKRPSIHWRAVGHCHLPRAGLGSQGPRRELPRSVLVTARGYAANLIDAEGPPSRTIARLNAVQKGGAHSETVHPEGGRA
jgi:hypothetical protein